MPKEICDLLFWLIEYYFDNRRSDYPIKKGEFLSLTIEDVVLHQEERMAQGAVSGNYKSNYVVRFKESPNGIAVVDSIAATKHPNWKKKTDNRANILTKELSGKMFSVCVKDIFVGKDTFEGVIQ